MLALNAAIEAARPAKPQRLRSLLKKWQLAEQSSMAAKDIQKITMKRKIQPITQSKKSRSNASVEEGSAKIADVMKILGDLRNSIESVNQKMYLEYEMMDKVPAGSAT